MKKGLIILFVLVMQSFLFAANNSKFEAKYFKRVDRFFSRYYKGLRYSADIKLKNDKIKLILGLDEDKFFKEDVDFIKTVIFVQLGLNKERGDKVAIFKCPLDENNNVIRQKTFFKQFKAKILEEPIYLLLSLLITFLLLLLLLIGVFFMVYLANMNRKIEQLILENRELAKKNILIDSHTYTEPEHKLHEKNKEVVMVHQKDDEILGILKKIDKLDKESSKKQKKKAKKLQFNDLINLPDKLLFQVLQKYDEHILAVALVGTSSELFDKIVNNLIYTRQQNLKLEMKKNKDLNVISVDAVFQMQNKILDGISKIIKSGKISSKF